MSPRIQSPSRAERGISMVELMVAMAISLIGTIVIFQVFEASEGIKRTTSSGGDAQQNGSIALFNIERDLRNAGMGFNDSAMAGCPMIGYDNQRVPPDFPVVGATFLMVPARIVAGANRQTPDQLVIMYGSQTHSASATTVNAPMGVATDPVRVVSTYGFRPGDLILLREMPPPSPGVSKNCVIMEVTSVFSDELRHVTGAYTTASGASAVARFNKPGGMGLTYARTPSTNVYNLGNLYDTNGMTLPVHTTYFIPKAPDPTPHNVLSQIAAFVVSPPAQIADNIVHMRALYGLDDGNNNGTVPYNTVYAPADGIVDRWVDAVSVPNPDWARVLSIRVAIVARSALPEVSSLGRGQPCDTTTVARGNTPTWSGDQWAGAPWNFQVQMDLTGDANWECYRYKTFETTVTLRNWTWRGS